ncbi:MAG: ribonuclease catalytic domain-containing protein, partial [Humidesulfovibrio sp.]|uniref:ribonuclease catalytic domain-containing protein n=1 Tax=Humidesulfovibrio sp. TaxID=2910988 RepID=UPI002736F737
MTKTLKLSGFLRPGCIVEFLQDNEAHIAWVLEEAQGRLRLLTRTKREVKLPSARLLPWSGPEYPGTATREEISHRLNDIDARRREIMAGVKAMELWEMAQGEVEHAPAEWFAGLLWTDPGVDEVAALGRALLNAKAHFKFQPPEFEIHPADKVEARLVREREEKDREAVANAGHAVLGALWARIKSGQPPLSPNVILREAEGMDPEVEARLRDMLLSQVAGRTGGEADALAKLWENLKKPLPDVPHLPLQLAQAWGVLPPHHNYMLDQAGYAWGDDWSRDFADETAAQKARFAALASAAAVDPTPYVSIDAATTRDIDDAFFVAQATLPDGSAGYSCCVTLARPGVTWDFGAPLDREVFSRATSLYLPEGSGHMMPEELGTGLYSLTADGPKPALVAEFLLNERAEIVEARPRLSWVRIKRNIAYPDAQAALDADSDPQLSLALKIARELFARRLERGAVVIDKPEPQVMLEGKGQDLRVVIETRETSRDAEMLVSEFMILANCGLACWARENGVPLLCRTQDIALPKEATGVFSDAVDIFRVVKLLAPPALECNPRKHAALACEAYATITSPIRRYVDFLNMAQVQSFLETGAPRLDKAGLEALIPHLSARIQEVGQVQRFRPRYWKLVYLSQRKREPFSAVVVEDAGPYPTLSLPDLQIT